MARSVIANILSQMAELFAPRKEEADGLGLGAAPASPSARGDRPGPAPEEPKLLPRLGEEQTILGSDVRAGTADECVEALLCRLVPALNAYAAAEALTSREEGSRRIEAYARGGCRYYSDGRARTALCLGSYLRVFDLPPALRGRIPALLASSLSRFENEEGLKAFVLELSLSNASKEEAAVLRGVFAALGVGRGAARKALRRARRLARSDLTLKNRL